MVQRISTLSLINCGLLLATMLGTAWSQQSFLLADARINMERASTSDLPGSCLDLVALGYNLNGYYLVTNSTTKSTQALYCDFKRWNQVSNGNINLKTGKMVSFNVGRNISFSNANTIIPFQVELLNTGGAMNTATGVFTAPVAGTYLFSFAGMKQNVAGDSLVSLQKNGVTISSSYAQNVRNFVPFFGTKALLKLVVNDTINLLLSWGSLYDDVNSYTHFTGFLVDQN